MSLTLEHLDACVPITGLKVFCVKDIRLILHSKGNHSCLIDEKNGKLLAKLETFKGHNIHGFLILDEGLCAEAQSVQIIAWGERSLRLIDLCCISDGLGGILEASLTAVSTEYRAPDWILAGCIDGLGNAYFVTGHNALLGLNVLRRCHAKYKKVIFLRQLAAGVKSMLFSADVISLTASHILIAAGTVFGEIIVWSYFIGGSGDTPSALASIHHFFKGHEGSIFGVNISPIVPFLHGDQPGRLLASCSDDRTVRIWDISDCELKSRSDQPAYITDGFELRNTGFGTANVESHELGSESYVAKAFGHISRIWGVKFLSLSEGSVRKVGLLSHGEDATCIVWSLTWGPSSEKSDFQLHNISSFHKHTGRNIFSLDMYSIGCETIVHTTGADGAIKSLSVTSSGAASLPSREKLTPGLGTSKSKSKGLIRACSFVSEDCIIATSVQGEIRLGWFTAQGQGYDLGVNLETIYTADDLRLFSAVASIPYKGLALIGNAEGLIRLYDHKTRTLSTLVQTDNRMPALFVCDLEMHSYQPSDAVYILSFVASYAADGCASLFTMPLEATAETDVASIGLDLPQHFAVSCASLVCSRNCLVLGSRQGALAVYHLSNTGKRLQPLISLPLLHGESSMTGVSKIIPFSLQSLGRGILAEHFITCGRDGDYCVHEINLAHALENPISIRTVHRSSISFGQNVAGAYFDSRSRDLMLYAFQHKQFILWNESIHTEVANIDCGGARGPWAFHPCTSSTDNVGVFTWAHAGTLNAHRIPADSRPLRAGTHGREIKTAGVFNAPGKKSTIFATGAEDTTVRIFEPQQRQTEDIWGAFKCLRVLKHNTALQQVSFSRDGDLLFASSGLEEFYVWRIQMIPVFGLAAHLLASSPKNDIGSDLRVTSFDVLDVEEEGSQQGFLLCQTLSNSTVKIFHFSLTGGGHFTLLARGRYTNNCLTQSRFLLQDSCLSLITTSTDGHFALWSLTAVLNSFYSISSSTLSVKQPVESLSVVPETITYEDRYQIHSNSVKSLDLVHMAGNAYLVITGGDDNAISLSILHTSSKGLRVVDRMTTATVTDAHAASITAVKALRRQSEQNTATSIYIASSGNDYRLKIWSVNINFQAQGRGQIDIQNVADKYSSVADISSVDVIYGNLYGSSSPLDEGLKLLVCGVGMEMLEVVPGGATRVCRTSAGCDYDH